MIKKQSTSIQTWGGERRSLENVMFSKMATPGIETGHI
jgi:hypothetical protein